MQYLLLGKLILSCLESFDKKKSIELAEKMWPIEPILNNDNEIVVGIIWDNSLKGKINLGDKILKFDTINYENMDYCEILNLILKVNKPKAKLTFQDKNTKEIKELELSKI